MTEQATAWKVRLVPELQFWSQNDAHDFFATELWATYARDLAFRAVEDDLNSIIARRPDEAWRLLAFLWTRRPDGLPATVFDTPLDVLRAKWPELYQLRNWFKPNEWQRTYQVLEPFDTNVPPDPKGGSMEQRFCQQNWVSEARQLWRMAQSDDVMDEQDWLRHEDRF